MTKKKTGKRIKMYFTATGPKEMTPQESHCYLGNFVKAVMGRETCMCPRPEIYYEGREIVSVNYVLYDDGTKEEISRSESVYSEKDKPSK